MKKYTIISLLILVVIGAFIFFTNHYSLFPFKNSPFTTNNFNIGNYDVCVNEYSATFPNDADKIKSICEMEKLIIEKPEDFKNYLNPAFEWKGLGEKNPKDNKVFFDRSIAIYTMANEKFAAKYLTSWNLAHIYKNIGDNENALKYFQMAVAKNDLDPEPYLALGEFFRYNLNKDANFMINYYENSIKNATFGPEELMDAYVRYLIEINDFARALPLAEKLETKFPGQYTEMIKEVKDQGAMNKEQ